MIDFEKCGGLVPTIVCDADDGRPRMLAYSTPQSLDAALREHAGIYWSRTRQCLWRKGERSGFTQRLISVSADCDRDTLVFYVEQTGPTCHKGTDRCFDEAPFSWSTLMSRVQRRTESSAGYSYTRELLANPALLAAKLIEEANEVAQAGTRRQVIWECADLLYFLTVKMQAASIGIADVMTELASRAR
ncbi:MAG TPA: phosphoribosyl-ATP diphosphatase [Candidatus Cybelea sp.]|jgi:phosphoribosyl-ATP pyrophosphohydrolase